MSRIIILVLTCFLLSCASHELGEDFNLATKPGYGLVVVSSSVAYDKCVDDSLFSGQIEDSEVNYFIYNADTDVMVNLPSRSFDNREGSNQRLLAPNIAVSFLALPEGRYYASSWTLGLWRFSLLGNGHKAVFPKSSFYMPFTVHAGEVKYIGSFALRFIDGCMSSSFSIKDERDRDLKSFSKSFNRYAIKDVVIDITHSVNSK